MSLIHTLLFLVRKDRLMEDLEMAKKCLQSLEKSVPIIVITFNLSKFKPPRSMCRALSDQIFHLTI